MRMFSFDGISDDDMGLIVEGIERSLVAPSSNKTQKVPGKSGEYFFGSEFGIRRTTIRVAFVGTNRNTVQENVRALAGWLTTDIPAPLIFADSPDYRIDAKLSGDTNLQEIARMRKGTLVFESFDPDIKSLNEDSTAVYGGSNLIVNTGGKKVYPRFDLMFSGNPTSFVKITRIDTGQYIMIGQSGTIDETPTSPWEDILGASCKTHANPPWIEGSAGVLHLGEVTGAMQSNGTSLSTDWLDGSYGVGDAWHGPLLIADCAEPTRDFILTVEGAWVNTGGENGRMYVFMIDSLGDTIGWLGLGDTSTSVKKTFFQARLRDEAGVVEMKAPFYPVPDTYFNNMPKFKFWVQRLGNRWYSSIYKWDTAKSAWVQPSGMPSTLWVDADSRFLDRQIAAIGIAQMAYGIKAPVTRMEFITAKVEKNVSTSTTIPNIIEPSQNLVIDFNRKLVLLDGSTDIMQYVSINDSVFFDMPVGETEVLIETEDGTTVAGNCYVTNRWL